MGVLTLLLSAGALELLSYLREWSWCKHHIGPKLPSEMHFRGDLEFDDQEAPRGTRSWQGVFPALCAAAFDAMLSSCTGCWSCTGMVPHGKSWMVWGKSELQENLLWESTECSSSSGKPTCAGLRTLQVAPQPWHRQHGHWVFSRKKFPSTDPLLSYFFICRWSLKCSKSV